ncbi:hypothetical protein RB195_023168 [Necator americanus]
MGATLSHRFADGCEKAIYHASRCLTQPQKNYRQIETETLALIFAMQKFHRFKDFGQVDALSRFVSSQSSLPEDYVIASIDADVISEFSGNWRHLSVCAESIRTATQADRLIQLVINYTKSGNWPEVSSVALLQS